MIHKFAVVETELIDDDVSVAEYSIIRAGASLGAGVIVHPHVVIESGVQVGEGTEIFPGAYLGKEPKGAGAVAREPKFERFIEVGANCQIGPHVVLFYDVKIGAGTLLGDGAAIREQCRIGSHCVVGRYVTVNYNSTIGDGTKVMDLSHVTGNCTIGEGAFISDGVSMVNDHRPLEPYQSERIVGPMIGDGATVGAGAILASGVVVGEGAIVGAGSLVVRDVAPRTMVAGMPARVIKHLDVSE